jgi:hypothetical protein
MESPTREETGGSPNTVYQVIRQKNAIEDRTFEIEVLYPGAQAFAFTFGRRNDASRPSFTWWMSLPAAPSSWWRRACLTPPVWRWMERATCSSRMPATNRWSR